MGLDGFLTCYIIPGSRSGIKKLTELTEKNSIRKNMNERSCYEVPPMKMASGYEAYNKK